MSKLYSHSRIACFEKCPRQFHFRYVLAIESQQEGIEAFLGKRVHEILERLYQFADEGRRPSLEKVLGRFRALWDQHYDASRIHIVRQENSATLYREIGERCLTLYYRRHYPFDDGKTLGLEKQLVFSIDTKKGYQIRGIVDRLTRARDGVLEIHDYKTSARAISQKDADEDRQLALYQLAIESGAGQKGEFDTSEGVRLKWHFLQKDEIRTSTRTSEQLAALRKKIIHQIDEIESAIEATRSAPCRIEAIAAKKSALCNWCDYAKLCSASNVFDAALLDSSLQQIAERGGKDGKTTDTTENISANRAQVEEIHAEDLHAAPPSSASNSAQTSTPRKHDEPHVIQASLFGRQS